MADLSTLDSASPAATDPVSEGDDKIRETRLATKTSFGGTDAGTGTQASEHYLLGAHKFPSGAAGARPTAGNANRLFLNTTDRRIERDTGSLWELLAAVPIYYGTNAGTAVTAPSSLVLQVTGIDVPSNGRLLILGTLNVNAPSVATLASGNYGVDSGAATTQFTTGVNVAASTLATIPIFGYKTGLSAGVHTVEMYAYSSSGTYTGYAALAVLVL